jgi:hypothetical protein
VLSDPDATVVAVMAPDAGPAEAETGTDAGDEEKGGQEAAPADEK